MFMALVASYPSITQDIFISLAPEMISFQVNFTEEEGTYLEISFRYSRYFLLV
jgi:hypothetical protein